MRDPLPQFSLGENWKLNKTFTLKSNISNKYRVPSFNEKYWIKDGKGNPNLKPENGIGFDAGIETNFKFASIINKLRTSIYSNSIKNWIQWVPVNTIYTAQNYQQVWTRGFEGAFDQTITFGKNGISWCIKYNYTPSTIEKSEDQQLIGKQLIYVPYHSATFNFNLKIHTANVGFDCNARSQSYSNAAQQGLPDNGFYIINCTINNTFLLKTHNFRIDLKINNLLDKQYYTYLPAYPMPGRAFYISFTYIFNKL